jgi:hypothetical protein
MLIYIHIPCCQKFSIKKNIYTGMCEKEKREWWVHAVSLESSGFLPALSSLFHKVILWHISYFFSQFIHVIIILDIWHLHWSFAFKLSDLNFSLMKTWSTCRSDDDQKFNVMSLLLFPDFLLLWFMNFLELIPGSLLNYTYYRFKVKKILAV